jgi:hypothetical protein
MKRIIETISHRRRWNSLRVFGFILTAVPILFFAPKMLVNAGPLPMDGLAPDFGGQSYLSGDNLYTTAQANATATAAAQATATGAAPATETAEAQAAQTAEIEATQTAGAPATETVAAQRTATADAESTQRVSTALAQATRTAAAGSTATAIAQANATAGVIASATAAVEATDFAIAQATEYSSLPSTATAEARATVAAEEAERLAAAWLETPRIFNPEFIIELIVTILVELLAAFLVIRGIFDKVNIRPWKVFLSVVPINLITVTGAWFAMWLLQTGTPIPYFVDVLMIEIVVFFLEALWYRITLRLQFREAFLLSFTVNLMSYAARVLLFGF